MFISCCTKKRFVFDNNYNCYYYYICFRFSFFWRFFSFFLFKIDFSLWIWEGLERLSSAKWTFFFFLTPDFTVLAETGFEATLLAPASIISISYWINQVIILSIFIILLLLHQLLLRLLYWDHWCSRVLQVHVVYISQILPIHKHSKCYRIKQS